MNGTDAVPLTATPPRADKVVAMDDTLTVDLEDGRTVSVPVGWFPRLAYGTPPERENFQINGPGMASTGPIWMKTLALQDYCGENVPWKILLLCKSGWQKGIQSRQLEKETT